MSAPATGCPAPGADWQRQGWCCLTCAGLAHPTWYRHDDPGEPGSQASQWACHRCGAAYFGTPPEHGLCPACKEGDQ